MNCVEMNPKLYFLADDELPAAEMQPVKEHLKQCAACRELLDALRQENTILGAETTVPAWDAAQLEKLETQLLRKIDSGQPAPWQEFLGFASETLGFGILIILICLVMQAARFNSGVLYELMHAGSMLAASKSLLSALLFVAGFGLMFFLYQYGQFLSLSKRTA
jgi:anti-sigma factor RsiW